MSVRGKQWCVALLGTALTLGMLWLGLWQMRVFEDKENESAAARAAQPPVALLDLVSADGTVGDVYGKGHGGRALPDQQLPVVAADGTTRIVTAFLLEDGRVLPVVRGSVPSDAGANAVPSAPSGSLTQGGVFLPSEAGADHETREDALGSVRLPALAQLWPQQLMPGFITLSAADSADQGLGPATTVLPTGEGSLQNAGYALQWWAFAAFAAFMTFRFVRTLGRRGSLGTLSTQEDE